MQIKIMQKELWQSINMPNYPKIMQNYKKKYANGKKHASSGWYQDLTRCGQT